MQLAEKNRKRRVLCFFFIICTLFFALIVRTFFLQIMQGPMLVEKALDQWTRDMTVSANRGSIFDNHGELLASNGSTYSVFIHPKSINTSRDKAENEAASHTVAKNLASILNLEEAAIYEKARDTSKYEVLLKRLITDEQVKQIKDLAMPGVSLGIDSKRYYPKGDLLTQVIGFTSIDGMGLEGIEAFYNKYLAGTPGKVTTQSDERGNELPFSNQFYIPPTTGYSLYMTIDYTIQSFAEKAAQDAYERYHSKDVMCIVMNPKTGAILAMTNRPGYDLNDPPRDNAQALTSLTRNLILADSNDPGSVFKVFTLSAALDLGLTSENERFSCNGGRKLASGFVKCAHNHGSGFTLSDGLAHSCNSVFMDLALRLGTTRLYEYIRKFGFGTKTGIDFPSEASGILIPEKDVKEGDLARIGFGQSITSTSLQTMAAFCAVINGGNLVKPHLLSKIVDNDGSTIKEEDVSVVRRVISEKTSERMRNLLRYVVTDGSGYLSNLSGYTVGGKTGTAQKYDENGKIKTTHLSSFIGFAPVEDPQLVVFFLVDEAQMDNDYGSQVAAPYVGHILEESLQYMGVQPKYSDDDLAKKASVQVPYVIGLSKEDAQSKLAAYGLDVIWIGSDGVATDQFPYPGTVVKKGEPVRVTLGKASASAGTTNTGSCGAAIGSYLFRQQAMATRKKTSC